LERFDAGRLAAVTPLCRVRIGLPFLATTAKEQLLVVVDSLSEAEAADALEYLSRTRPAGASTDELLDGAPLDDEPFTDEDERAVAETRGRRDRVSLADARSELL